MVYNPVQYYTDVRNPANLPHFVLLAETIKLATSGQPTRPYLGVKRDGALPTGTTQKCAGVIYSIRDSYATVVTEGIYVVEVPASTAIALDAPIAINASGQAVTGVPGTDQIIGRSLDVTTNSAGVKYIRVKISG